MVLKNTKQEKKKMIGCKSYPKCTAAFFLPVADDITVTDELCEECSTTSRVYKLHFKFSEGNVPTMLMPTSYTCCILCDSMMSQLVNYTPGKATTTTTTTTSSHIAKRPTAPPKPATTSSSYRPPPAAANPPAQRSWQQNAPPTSTIVSNNTSTSTNGDNVFCGCGKPAPQRICRQSKVPENVGRSFFKCDVCNFFAWK